MIRPPALRAALAAVALAWAGTVGAATAETVLPAPGAVGEPAPVAESGREIGAASGPTATPEANSAPPVAAADLDPERLAVAVDRYFAEALAAADVPGAAVAVVRAGREPLLRGYGHARLDPAVPVDPAATVFRVGSVSKPLTTTLALVLAETGRLALDADVVPLLAGEVRFVGPGRGRLTPFHLLTHTDGLDETLFGQHAQRGEEWLDLAGYLARRPQHRFAPPGRMIAYNDQGIALAGRLIELATGRDFATAAEELLFAPLGMERSTFRQVDLPAAIDGATALAYRWDGEEHVLLPRDVVHTPPAAGLWTTAADMARYLGLLLAPGAAEDAALAAAAAGQRATRVAHGPGFAGRTLGFAEGEEGGWRVLHKDGQASGFSARMAFVPEAGIGWFSVSNRSILDPGWSFNAATRLHRGLAAEIVAELGEPPAAGVGGVTTGEAAPPAPLAAAARTPVELLAGTYRPVVGSRRTVEKLLWLGQELVVTADSGRPSVFGVAWEEVEPGLFRSVGGETPRLRFALAGDRPATHLFFQAGAWERVPAWESVRGATVVAAACGAAFLLALVGWPLARRRAGPWQRRALARAQLAAALHLLFVAVFFGGFFRLDPQLFFFGLPPLLVAALALPLAALAVSALAAAAVVVAARRHEPGRLAWATLALSFAALAAFPALLAVWNLLGWRL
ncbi:MAG TPA: serine hydrolase [Thermoanaerobaculia bacterium]|nr:serine hydrolase [Thermoanaerobaculia bacterium]